MTNPSLTGVVASRFYTRWISADPARASLVENYARLSLDQKTFAKALNNDMAAGLPLSRAMRRLRNLVMAVLIERDLTGKADLNEVVSTMTALAEFALQSHVAALTEELILRHGIPIGEESGARQEMIVLGMGKLGGGELNVSSDIDLIFVYPEDGETETTSEDQKSLSNHEFFTRLGKKLIHALSEIEEDGFTFRVDMALRPNGASGPLVASFGMVEEYLIVQGREWERYAWVKARALTGQASDIEALESIVRPFVYRRYLDFSAIEAMRGMHAQIRAEVIRQETRHPERSHNVKLGRGGIREIEFLAQVFQLIRGGRDPDLRDRSTRRTLRVLADKQLLSPAVVEQLLEAYTFLRDLEHRLQYLDDAQTHTLPANQEDQLTVANMMGFADVVTLLGALNERRSFVAAQFDEIFSDKTGGNTDDESSGEDNTSQLDIQEALSHNDGIETLQSSLASLGFAETAAAAKRLQSMWESSRLQSLPEASRNRIVTLLNTSLPDIASYSDAQLTTLYRLLDFLEAIARRASYLALLTEYPHALKRVIRMMHASSWAAQYLTRYPIVLDELLDDRTLRAAPDWPAFSMELQRQMEAAAGDTERQMDILREMHHAQLMRLLAQDLEGELTVERLADHLSALADILVAATITAVWSTVNNRHRDLPRFAVIAYGKLGGKELGYASDLDIIFLYDDEDQDAPANYAKLAQRFITWMTSHTAAGILFDIDIALRPNGASGLLVTSIGSFEKYQTQSAWIWEHQALTRARFCAGDAQIGEHFEKIREAVLRQARDPQKLRQEVMSMRQRMHDGHPNHSMLFDLKHDAGGMIDIEFIVQYLILQHAPQYPELVADIGNIALLKLCGKLGLINAPLAEQVADAYRTYRRLQHQIRLQGADKARAKPEKVAREAAAVTQLWAEIFRLKQ